MSPFKRPGRPNYFIEPTIPGVGRIRRMSTGTCDKRIAEAMESMLADLAMTGRAGLVFQLHEGDVQLTEIWAARQLGSDALDALQNRKGDPPLVSVVDQYRPLVNDERTLHGLDQLLAYAPAGVRLSWLRDATHVSDIYRRAQADGRKANSVRRSLHRAVSELLTHRYGRGQMRAVMADATVPSENDERHVVLTPAEIGQALEQADYAFRPFLGLALTTGIDRGPELKLLVRDFEPETNTLFIPDSKTAARPRTIQLGPAAAGWVRTAIAGRPGPEPVFTGIRTDSHVRSRWDAIRNAIGRPECRWKDLRASFATYFLMGGGSPRELQDILGHTTPAMTLRYIKRLPIRSGDAMDDAARAMGLRPTHLKLMTGET